MKTATIRPRIVLALLFGLGACFGPSVKEERELGNELAKEVEEQIGLYPAHAGSWCTIVGDRLVSSLEKKDLDRGWEFAFDVVDQEEPNAFALPGGHIYVSRGLLALVVSEDELAGVLAHEITHVTERHSTARAKRAVLPAILTIPGRIVGVVVDETLGDLVAAPFEVVGGLGLARYSREQESEADEKGSKLAAKAGYDPRALARILDRLEKDAARIAGKERRPTFFDDHPSTPTRVASLDRDASKIRWTPREPVRTWPAILDVLEGLPWGVNPDQGVFVGPLFLHPVLGFALRFPEGWSTANTPSVVGATRERESVIALGALGASADPDLEGRTFENRLREKGTKPDEAGPLEVNGNHAYVVRVSNARSDEYAFSLWVRMRGTTYRIVGIGPRIDQHALWSAATSLRSLTDAESRSIMVVRIRAARARGGETLARFGETVHNVWPPSYTALVNARDPRAPLARGALVKIATVAPYVPPARPGRAHD